MNITFIGNCQSVSLCFYFQQLLNSNEYNVCWVLYGEEFKPHIGNWSAKCKNKIIDYDSSVQQIKESDIIIYQNISTDKSLFSNTGTLKEMKKGTCKLVQIPSIYLVYDDFDNSISDLVNREIKNNVDIKVSFLFTKFKTTNLMLTHNHPKTFLFMEIVKMLCDSLALDFFKEDQYTNFIKNENYMELP
jgi:hypothetical protein